MPPNIAIGILALIVALVLYTIAVWQAFRTKTLVPKQLYLLWAGFVFDVVATAMMAIQAGGIQRDLHTALALAGMAGMLAAAAVGTWAYRAGDSRVLGQAARWVAAPWVLWVVVFVWGMVSRGAQRMGG